MEKCFRCKRTAEEARIFPGVYVNQSVEVCEACSKILNIPFVKIPSTSQLKESEKNATVRNRLRSLSGMREEKKAQRQQIGRVRMTVQETGRSGQRVIKATHLGFSYDEKCLIRDFWKA